jgi:uncharacterized membrane protein YphA (DoxX/SURF4 family)
MFTCSTLVIIRKHSDYAVAGLMGVVITQALGYGLIFDLNFFLRNLSVIGGLVMVLSDSWVRKTQVFAGLPQIDEKDRKMYFQLAGRVLLIFLFIGFVFSGEWSLWRVIVSSLGGISCVMVVVGFKAKYSATLLVVILSIFNLLVNNFWTVSCNSQRLLLCLQKTNQEHSSTSTTPTRTLPSTTSSRFYPSLVDSCCSSTAAQASSASTRRRRSTKPRLGSRTSELHPAQDVLPRCPAWAGHFLFAILGRTMIQKVALELHDCRASYSTRWLEMSTDFGSDMGIIKSASTACHMTMNTWMIFYL